MKECIIETFTYFIFKLRPCGSPNESLDRIKKINVLILLLVMSAFSIYHIKV